MVRGGACMAPGSGLHGACLYTWPCTHSLPSSSEVDQLGRIAAVLGSPEDGTWPQFASLAGRAGFSLPYQPAQVYCPCSSGM